MHNIGSASALPIINTDDHLCNCSGATELDSSGSVDLYGAHFREWNKYAGTHSAKMSTMVLIFADGAQIRARVCAPVHVYAEGNEYATPSLLVFRLHRLIMNNGGECEDIFSTFVDSDGTGPRSKFEQEAGQTDSEKMARLSVRDVSGPTSQS